LLTATVPYAAKVYHQGDANLGVGLAVVRAGVLLASALASVADRRGRRNFLVVVSLAHCVATAVIGLAPTYSIYIGGHVVLRCLDTSIGIGLGVLVAELVPAGDRAYCVAMVGVVGGIGVALATVLLPVAASGRAGLSAVYLVQLLAIPVIWRTRHRLAESPRYLVHRREPHRWNEVLGPSYRGRLALAGGTLFLAFIFYAPAIEFANRYLDKVRGFPSSRIVLFGAVVSIPFLPMTILGARWADRRGRKLVAVPGVIGSTVLYALVYLLGGAPMWVCGFLASVFVAPALAAIGVYASELFPTRLRSTANTAVNAMGVVGSAIGLVIAGRLSDRLGIGRAVAVLAVFPVIAACVLGFRFPETARRSLEETSGDTAVPFS
jgi:putative MFS transporter